MNSPNRIDRRRFLAGTAGGLLALPMLRSLGPRSATAAETQAPKRLVVVMHPHGRTIGSGRTSGGEVQDKWSPRSTSGELTAMSPMLQALEPIREHLVTVDNVDNLVRHMTGNGDGHLSGSRTCLTCQVMKPNYSAAGPSFDFVMGERLRSNPSQLASIVLPASATQSQGFSHSVFFGSEGTPPRVVNSNPKIALSELFATDNTNSGTLNLRERLSVRRSSILDSVSESYSALSRTVSAEDRQKLEQHASFIRDLEERMSIKADPVLALGCRQPSAKAMPDLSSEDMYRGAADEIATPWQVENLVMSLACDITRVASLHFQLEYDPEFKFEFTGDSPFAGAANYHALIHETQALGDPYDAALTQAFQHYGSMFTRLVQRLRDTEDVDGSSMLDNTLVLWVSDMGYGAPHADFNVPIVMAGMKGAFTQGQGRHIVNSNRRSLGDLFASVMRLYGGTDETFGVTGSLGDTGFGSNLNAWAGYEGYIQADLPTHAGLIEL